MNVVFTGAQIVLVLGIALFAALLLGTASALREPMLWAALVPVRLMPGMSFARAILIRRVAGLLTSTPLRVSPPLRARPIDFFQRLVSRKL